MVKLFTTKCQNCTFLSAWLKYIFLYGVRYMAEAHRSLLGISSHLFIAARDQLTYNVCNLNWPT
jgi:hypothetical protein